MSAGGILTTVTCRKCGGRQCEARQLTQPHHAQRAGGSQGQEAALFQFIIRVMDSLVQAPEKGPPSLHVKKFTKP